MYSEYVQRIFNIYAELCINKLFVRNFLQKEIIKEYDKKKSSVIR